MTGRLNKILVLLLGAYLLIFLQSHLDWPRLWLGFQPDLTPALLVCVGGRICPLSLPRGPRWPALGDEFVP